MKKLTYIEARDKIWAAYFRDEIRPFNSEFCFCGTLSAVGPNWNTEYIPEEHNYSYREYKSMEWALFTGSSNKEKSCFSLSSKLGKPDYEDTLFAGMVAALEVLKRIHKRRGDFIPEDEPLLTKRNLAAVAQ